MSLPISCAASVAMLAAVLSAGAASPPAGGAAWAGRWEGVIQTPGAPVAVVLDLEKAGDGKWAGSAIFPAFGVKGAPLKDLSIDGSSIVFAVKDAMGTPKITAQLGGDRTLSGKYEQGGNSAALFLRRTGNAQVDLPPVSTAIQKELEGEWRGVLQIGEFKLHLGLKLSNSEKGPATGQLIMIDSGNYSPAVELITQRGDNLELTIPAVNFGYEGRLDSASGELRGVLRLSSLELPFVWSRPAK